MRSRHGGAAAIPQAFPYQGSKRALAPQILALLPMHAGPVELIEPCAGSAAISVAARMFGLAGTVTISDSNEALMALWRRIIDDPNAVADRYARMWHEQLGDPRAYFESVRREFNVTHEPTLLLYLLARCVKAAVRYSRAGEFNQSADHRRLGAHPDKLRARMTAASGYLTGAVVRTDSYDQLLAAAPRDAVVYLDPPYQGTSAGSDRRYRNGLRRCEFAAALAVAVEHAVSFVASYDVVTDDDRYGRGLPGELGLTHRHVIAGTSAQATLHGRSRTTIESLYLSPALVARLGGIDEVDRRLDAAARRLGRGLDRTRTAAAAAPAIA